MGLEAQGRGELEQIRWVALLGGHWTKHDDGGGGMEHVRAPSRSWEGEREATVRERGKIGGREEWDEVGPGVEVAGWHACWGGEVTRGLCS